MSTPTPKTDTEVELWAKCYSYGMVSAGFARNLEREMQSLTEVIQDNERWQKEVLTDYKINFDDHEIGRRLAFTQFLFDTTEENRKLKESNQLLHDEYMEIRKLVGSWDTNTGGENRFELTKDKIISLQKTIQALREALQHYAKREMWRKEVIDSYSGECNFFDWPGDLADEPWEFAEKALSSTPEDFSKKFVRREVLEKLYEAAKFLSVQNFRTTSTESALTLAKQELEKK